MALLNTTKFLKKKVTFFLSKVKVYPVFFFCLNVTKKWVFALKEGFVEMT